MSDVEITASLFAAVSKGITDELHYAIGQANKHNLILNTIRDRRGSTLLHAACSRDKEDAIEIFRILFQNGVSPHVKDAAGFTALTEMTRARIYKAKLAEKLSSSRNDRDNSGRTALMFAARGAGLFGRRTGSLTIVRHLLSLDADLFICDNSGKSALGHAISSNDTGQNEEMIEFLKNEMIRQTAVAEFKKTNKCEFDKSGNLHFSKKTR